MNYLGSINVTYRRLFSDKESSYISVKLQMKSKYVCIKNILKERTDLSLIRNLTHFYHSGSSR